MNNIQLVRNGPSATLRQMRPHAPVPQHGEDAALRTRALAIGEGECIDDDVCEYLAGFAIDVKTAHGQAEIRRRLAPGRFDLILLDLAPADHEGLKLCVWVQQLVPNIPVIILTARDDLSTRIAGLELGADDCLARPFDPRELAARVKAVLRRRAAPPWNAHTDRFDHWVFDRVRRQLLMDDGSAVSLSAYEARLLSVFIEHPWQLLTRDRLLAFANVSERSVTYRSVDLAVSRLRGKLGDDAHHPTMIRTVRGEGYLFGVGPRNAMPIGVK
jgi:two-component system OmpR family response regulator